MSVPDIKNLGLKIQWPSNFGAATTKRHLSEIFKEKSMSKFLPYLITVKQKKPLEAIIFGSFLNITI